MPCQNTYIIQYFDHKCKMQPAACEANASRSHKGLHFSKLIMYVWNRDGSESLRSSLDKALRMCKTNMYYLLGWSFFSPQTGIFSSLDESLR